MSNDKKDEVRKLIQKKIKERKLWEKRSRAYADSLKIKKEDRNKYYHERWCDYYDRSVKNDTFGTWSDSRILKCVYPNNVVDELEDLVKSNNRDWYICEDGSICTYYPDGFMPIIPIEQMYADSVEDMIAYEKGERDYFEESGAVVDLDEEDIIDQKKKKK